MNESHDLELGFDPADTELARRLGAAAPAPGDADAVLAGMQPRLTRARRRRRTGAIAIGAASLALFAGVAFAATDGSNGAKVRVPPADRSTPITTVTEPSPTTSTTSTTTVSTNPPVTPTTIDDKGGDSGNSGSGSGSSGSGSSGSGTSGSGSSGSGSGKSGSDD